MDTRTNQTIRSERNVIEMILSARPKKIIDKYINYLHGGPRPADKPTNPKNLFDDSNKENRKWLKQVRKYLSKMN